MPTPKTQNRIVKEIEKQNKEKYHIIRIEFKIHVDDFYAFNKYAKDFFEIIKSFNEIDYNATIKHPNKPIKYDP